MNASTYLSMDLNSQSMKLLLILFITKIKYDGSQVHFTAHHFSIIRWKSSASQWCDPYFALFV
jgi:hypothetical protein